MNKQFFTFLWADNKEVLDRFSQDAIKEMRGITHLSGLPLTLVDVATPTGDIKPVILPLHVDDLKEMIVSLDGASTTLFLSGCKKRKKGFDYITVLCHAIENLDWDTDDRKVKEKAYLIARQLAKEIQKRDRLNESTTTVRDTLNSLTANSMPENRPGRPSSVTRTTQIPPGQRLN